MKDVIGFQWDSANQDKSWLKHKVAYIEAEQVFFNQPLIVQDDVKHSTKESRYVALGKTNHNRLLTIIYTIRQKHIRIISARPMSKKERNAYEKTS